MTLNKVSGGSLPLVFCLVCWRSLPSNAFNLSQEAELCAGGDPVFLCVTQCVPQTLLWFAGGAWQVMLLSHEAVLCTDSDPIFLCVTQHVPQLVHGSAGEACQIMLLSQEAVLGLGGDPVFLCIT